MIEYIEIRNQEHLMDAEGSDDRKFSKLDVLSAIRKRGYIAGNIAISFDEIQKTWRFTASIKQIPNATRESDE